MRSRVAEANGFTTRVYIMDNVQAPFQALIEPDTDLTNHFRAWSIDREIFVIVDGQSVEVEHVH